MDDNQRKRLDNRLTPLQLYKLTPKTNCGECGLKTCLAFATQVIVGQVSIDACPYLDRALMEPFKLRLREQHRAGIGVSRESFEKTLEFLRKEMERWEPESVADSLGASLIRGNEGTGLRFGYFKDNVIVSRGDAILESGQPIDPWEKILIFNYVIGGAAEPSGIWVGMESLPNSVSKIKSLKSHCEIPLAERFAGKLEELPPALEKIGERIHLSEERVDFAAQVTIFPKLCIRILWWDEDVREGFGCVTKFLFDSRVLQTVDLESLVFASEQVTQRLLGTRGRSH
ncbi:MAG: DUF3786 domain-containing protein [Deltaproteobacteria bacterium]|nr:DUF3786 domain-containing protein [Deltaproteobacteria bacterium]